MDKKQLNEPKIAIVAMGNSCRQDDSVGIEIATRCKRLESEKLVVLNEGNNGISFLDFVHEINNVIIVDAVDYGAGPGDIRVFDYNEFIEGSFNLVSSHTYDVFSFMTVFSPKIKIVGIQPKLMAWGMELSEEVEGSIQTAINVIKRLVDDWSINA